MPRLSTTLRAVGLLAALALLAPAQSAHPTAFTGTWKLNPAKSRFHPGPPFRAFTLSFTPDGVRHLDLTLADGTILQIALPWSDGKPVTPAGAGMENTTVISTIRGRALKDTWRRATEIIEQVRGRVSKDGRTLTMDVRGPLPHGATFHNTVVFDRQ